MRPCHIAASQARPMFGNTLNLLGFGLLATTAFGDAHSVDTACGRWSLVVDNRVIISYPSRSLTCQV